MDGFVILGIVLAVALLALFVLRPRVNASSTRPTNTRKALRNDLSRNSRNDDVGGCTGGGGGCSDCGGCD